MNIKEIRMKNFQALLKTRKRKDVAEAMGYSNTVYINQMYGGHVNIGDETARNIENALDIEPNWMDQDHHSLAGKMHTLMIDVPEQLHEEGLEFLENWKSIAMKRIQKETPPDKK